MRNFLATLTGKTVRAGLFFRRGGGHTLPGLIIEKFFPDYVRGMLQKLPEGVVIITGTNGKTTTTKMVTEILKAHGKKVITNSTGSNLLRGVASSLSRHATITGRLKYDVAVLELDEATARKFVKIVPPRWVLALNVSRDQLDRYGEVDTIASHIGTAMEAATEGVVSNAHDPHLLMIAGGIERNNNAKVYYFSAAKSLNRYFPSDYELAAVSKSGVDAASAIKAAVRLVNFSGQKVEYQIGDKKYDAKLSISGQHNYLNGAAALALTRQLLPEVSPRDLVNDLSKVSLAFGRGEKYRLKNQAEIELVLVKNPASFTQALSSYGSKKQNLMIAINDNIADGRDVSWLWDVNFAPLNGQTVFLTSGRRAADMALRLSYDGIKSELVEPNLPKALRLLAQQNGDKVVLATYTAMLQLYGILSKQGEKIS